MNNTEDQNVVVAIGVIIAIFVAGFVFVYGLNFTNNNLNREIESIEEISAEISL